MGFKSAFKVLNEYHDNNKFSLVNVSHQYSIVLVSHNFRDFVLVLLFHCILSCYSDTILYTITNISFL
jgi:hypothetical protein